MTQVNLNELTGSQLLDLAKALNVLDEKKKYNKLDFIFPDTGPLSRDKYKKPMLFFKAGAVYRERALIAGNRTGKSFTASAEVTYHLTGKYPKWWVGKRFNEPIEAWCVGKTHETTRDILQAYLYGKFFDPGTGMIPKVDIVDISRKTGTANAIQDIYVNHYTDGLKDGVSHCQFKTYIQGIDAFMGTSIHVVHLDEEPSNPDIYTECLTRTMTTNGIVLCTFTPLQGLSKVVLTFLPGGKFPPGGIGEVNTEEHE